MDVLNEVGPVQPPSCHHGSLRYPKNSFDLVIARRHQIKKADSMSLPLEEMDRLRANYARAHETMAEDITFEAETRGRRRGIGEGWSQGEAAGIAKGKAKGKAEGIAEGIN